MKKKIEMLKQIWVSIIVTVLLSTVTGCFPNAIKKVDSTTNPTYDEADLLEGLRRQGDYQRQTIAECEKANAATKEYLVGVKASKTSEIDNITSRTTKSFFEIKSNVESKSKYDSAFHSFEGMVSRAIEKSQELQSKVKDLFASFGDFKKKVEEAVESAKEMTVGAIKFFNELINLKSNVVDNMPHEIDDATRAAMINEIREEEKRKEEQKRFEHFDKGLFERLHRDEKVKVGAPDSNIPGQELYNPKGKKIMEGGWLTNLMRDLQEYRNGGYEQNGEKSDPDKKIGEVDPAGIMSIAEHTNKYAKEKNTSEALTAIQGVIETLESLILVNGEKIKKIDELLGNAPLLNGALDKYNEKRRDINAKLDKRIKDYYNNNDELGLVFELEYSKKSIEDEKKRYEIKSREGIENLKSSLGTIPLFDNNSINDDVHELKRKANLNVNYKCTDYGKQFKGLVESLENVKALPTDLLISGRNFSELSAQGGEEQLVVGIRKVFELIEANINHIKGAIFEKNNLIVDIKTTTAATINNSTEKANKDAADASLANKGNLKTAAENRRVALQIDLDSATLDKPTKEQDKSIDQAALSAAQNNLQLITKDLNDNNKKIVDANKLKTDLTAEKTNKEQTRQTETALSNSIAAEIIALEASKALKTQAEIIIIDQQKQAKEAGKNAVDIRIGALRNEIATKTNEISQQDNIIANANNENLALQVRIDAEKAIIAPLQANINTLTGEINRLSSIITGHPSKIANQDTTIIQLENEIKTLKSDSNKAAQAFYLFEAKEENIKEKLIEIEIKKCEQIERFYKVHRDMLIRLIELLQNERLANAKKYKHTLDSHDLQSYLHNMKGDELKYFFKSLNDPIVNPPKAWTPKKPDQLGDPIHDLAPLPFPDNFKDVCSKGVRHVDVIDADLFSTNLQDNKISLNTEKNYYSVMVEKLKELKSKITEDPTIAKNSLDINIQYKSSGPEDDDNQVGDYRGSENLNKTTGGLTAISGINITTKKDRGDDKEVATTLLNLTSGFVELGKSDENYNIFNKIYTFQLGGTVPGSGKNGSIAPKEENPQPFLEAYTDLELENPDYVIAGA